MAQQQFAKHLTAVVAPFAEDDTIDEHALRAVCRHALDVNGVDGLVVNAHASEVNSMTMDERIRMIEIASEESRQRGARIVSGVVPFPGSNAGGAATAQTMQEAGADGTLLILHCLLGGPIIEMFDAVNDGDTARAAKINEDHERLIEVLFRQPMIRMPSRMKYALYLTGVIPDDRTRASVPPPSDEDKQIIQEELLELGMIGQQAIAAAGE